MRQLTQQLRKRVRNAKSRFLYRHLPGLVDRLVSASAYSGRRAIAAHDAGRLLIDSSVMGHAITHETAWIDTGTALWGGKHEVATGYSARIAVHSDSDESEVARSIRYLPAIASLARSGHVQLCTSMELRDEQMTQPIGRFSGYGYYDFNLFGGLQFEDIPDPDFRMMIGAPSFRFPSLEQQRKERLARKTDPLYVSLRAALGEKNSQDAYHIYTAEIAGCFCFLTMDFKLARTVRQLRHLEVFANLRTLVLSPEDYGMRFGLKPMPLRLFSYHGASYPVRPELNWPDSKRRRPKKS